MVSPLIPQFSQPEYSGASGFRRTCFNKRFPLRVLQKPQSVPTRQSHAFETLTPEPVQNGDCRLPHIEGGVGGRTGACQESGFYQSLLAQFGHIFLEVIQSLENQVMLLLIGDQVFQQRLLHEELAFLLALLRHFNGLSLHLVMSFDLFPDLGQFVVGKIYRLFRETVNNKLLHSMMLDGIIPDNFHHLSYQEIIGFFHDFGCRLNGVTFNPLPVPQGFQQFVRAFFSGRHESSPLFNVLATHGTYYDSLTEYHIRTERGAEDYRNYRCKEMGLNNATDITD
jgi:hypothetical protein